MNIVTIYEYPNNLHNVIMLRMFIDSIRKHCVSCPYKLHIISDDTQHLRKITADHKNIILIKPNKNKLRSPHRNINRKLFYVSNLNFDFIFLDCDMYINQDLKYLWDRRKDMPYIGTVHQNNIKGTLGLHTSEDTPHLNSGLQIISDSDFLKYDEIFKVGEDRDFRFEVSGYDQALLHTYFEHIGYSYTHPEIGPEWNSCAGYSQYKTENGYDFAIEYVNGPITYPVKINHYWDEFRPWIINCPIFKYYSDVLI